MLLVARPADAADAVVPAILELYVNTVDKGIATAAFAGKEILIASDDLANAGIRVTGGERQDIGGRSFWKMSSLVPKVATVYDERDLSLRLTVDPLLLGTSDIELRAAVAPANLIRTSDPSAFLNYAINGVNGTRPSFFTEQGASVAGVFFDDTLTLLPSGALTRGATSLTLDDRDNLTRATLGDITASGGTLGGAVSLGGIGYSKNFAIDPYFLPFPTQRFAGIVSTPSTAQVFVNGQLVRTLTLPPGPFNLVNIPATSGAGVTRIVIRDALGQQRELTGPYYQSAAVLKSGLNQFSYNLGLTRVPSTSAAGDYQMPAVTANHLYGFSDDLTLGGIFQADRHLVVAGPQAALVLPAGQVSLAAAASGVAAGGLSSSLGYSYQTRSVNFGITGIYTSSHFANLSLSPAFDRPRWQVTTAAAAGLGEWTGLLSLSQAQNRDSGGNNQASVTVSRRLTDALNFSFTVGQSRVRGQSVDTSAFLAFSFALGTNTTGTASATTSRTNTIGSAQVSRSLPLGPGYGYLLQAQTGRSVDDAANFQYQTDFGSYEADVDRLAGQNTVRYSASGALAVLGGTIKPTLALRDAYALIRVPDTPGITGYLSNQDVGQTDASGDLLIPNLTSYFGNRLGINLQDIPLDYSVASTELQVAPAYRSGAVVEFPVRRFQAITGTVVVETANGAVVPAYGDFTVTAPQKTFDSPIGEHGEFYFESLPSGGVPAIITYGGGECRFTMTVPASAERIVKLGKLACAVP